MRTAEATLTYYKNFREPMKVKYQNRHGEGSDLYHKDYYNCSRCGRRLRNKQRDPFCPKCGQALDWNYKEETK